MIRYITAVVGVLTLLALVPASLAAQDRPTRDGFWMNVGLGYGSLGQEEFNGRQGGEAVQLVFGGTVNDRLLVGGSINGWTRLENGVRLEVGLVAATARFYPSETSAFFVTGGLGIGTIHEDVAFSGTGNETGFGALLGLGYDVRLGSSVSLSPFVNGLFVGNSNSDVNVVQTGLGVTVH